MTISPAPKVRRNKYRAKKTVYNRNIYDSKGEAKLAFDIDCLIRAGKVATVSRQVRFGLRGLKGGQVCTHVVDFVVTLSDGTKEAWEYKGMPTPTWKLKRKLFLDNYPEIKYVVIGKKR